MAKYTSYHLMGGQIYYSKTGRAVPLKYADKLRVDVGKRTVYKDGRKVGTLKQKNLSKKARTTLKTNAKRTKRVTKVVRPSGIIKSGHVGGGGRADGGVFQTKEKISRDLQNAINFRAACTELLHLKSITQSEFAQLVAEYMMADDVRKAELWAYVHSRFDEYGIEYKTLGWVE